MSNASAIEQPSIDFEFQWVVGDLSALEAILSKIGTPPSHRVIMLVSRVTAYATTFLVAWLLLPDEEFTTIFLIALSGSLSIWVAFFSWRGMLRLLQRFQAMDSMKVGWNRIRIDQTGILRFDDTTQDYISWFAVSDVQEREGAVWIKTGRATGLFLPSRLFDSPDQLQECLAKIDELRANPSKPIHISDEVAEPVTKH